MNNQSAIREEELKNRAAALYFGRFDCTRIVGNIDFCVPPKRRDPRQMTFISDAPILWAEAKNHPTGGRRTRSFSRIVSHTRSSPISTSSSPRTA